MSGFAAQLAASLHGKAGSNTKTMHAPAASFCQARAACGGARPRPPPRPRPPITYHGLAEVGAEAALVQCGRHQLAKGGGLDVTLLPQLVHVVPEREALRAAGTRGRAAGRGGVVGRRCSGGRHGGSNGSRSGGDGGSNGGSGGAGGVRPPPAAATVEEAAAGAAPQAAQQLQQVARPRQARGRRSQRLCVRAQPRQPDEQLVVDAVDLLVVCGQRLQETKEGKQATEPRGSWHEQHEGRTAAAVARRVQGQGSAA